MELQQIEAFYTIIQERSFVKAAEKLHITQPAISARISNLEAELNTELFRRDGRTIQLSEQGQMLESYAERILNLEKEIKDEMGTYSEIEATQLFIGSTSRIGTYILPTLIKNFCDRYPKVTVNVQIHPSETVIDMLKNHTIQVGLTSTEIKDSKYIIEPLIEDHIILVTSPIHPLHQKYLMKGAVTIDDLDGHTIINFNHETLYYKPINQLFKQHGIHSKQHIFIDNIEAMKQMTIQNLGVAFLPRMVVKKEVLEGQLVQIPLQSFIELKNVTYLIYQKKKHLNPALKKFIYSAKKATSTQDYLLVNT